MHKVISMDKIIESNVAIATIEYSAWFSITDHFSLERIGTVQYVSKKEAEWLNYATFKASDSFLHSVDVAVIDKQLYKINGIIRKVLWENNRLIKPSTLIIRVHKLDNEFYQVLSKTLYPISPKRKAQDTILACYKKNNLNFKSDRLRHGYISDALNIALRGEPRLLQDKRTLKQEVNIDLAIKHFKVELIIIDSIMPDINIFSTGVLAAALIILSIDEDSVGFFKKLNSYQGITKDERQDPVEALLRIIELFKKKKGFEAKIQIELCSKTIRAISAWKAGENGEGYWIKRLSSVDFLPDIRKMKQLKKIHGIKEL